MEGLYKASEMTMDAPEISKVLEQRFPDLMIYRPNLSKRDVIYCSSSVNSYVDQYDCTENQDNVGEVRWIFIWPFTVIEQVKVYSVPPYYVVGAPNSKGFGIIPENRWDDKLTEDNIPNSIVRKVRFYLKSKPPIDYT